MFIFLLDTFRLNKKKMDENAAKILAEIKMDQCGKLPSELHNDSKISKNTE